MQKKSKTILTAVVTALFVLSISYFALLAPTTAWYYQNEDKSFSFTFGNFSMNAPEPLSGQDQTDIKLRGTTRFADAGEVLFDEMTHVIKVTATNGSTSEMSGNVGVKVKKGDTELNVDDGSTSDTYGLKWFVYEPKDTAVTVGSAAANTLKIANAFSEALTLTLKLTAQAAATVSDNGSNLSLTEGVNTVSVSVNAGSVYSISSLPADIAFSLELPADKAAYIVGGGKKIEGTVPAGGRNIEIGYTAKSAIDTMLKASNSAWPIDYKTGNFNTYSGDTLEAKYEDYNAKAIAALKENNKRGISVARSQTKSIYIVFWAEYGDLKNDFQVTSAPDARAITTKTYGAAVDGSNPVTYDNLTIEIFAAPDTGGTQTASLTITSESGLSGTNAVKLYQWTNNAWTVYTGAYVTQSNGSIQTQTQATGDSGLINVPGSAGSATVSDLPVGARFKLESQNATVKLYSGDTAMQANDAGTEITGTLANVGGTVTLGQTRTLQITSRKASDATGLKLYVWNTGTSQWSAVSGTVQTLSGGTWGSGTNISDSTISVPAGSVMRVTSTSFTVNARYKLEITDATPTEHFNNSGNATQIIGTLSGAKNTVEIVPNA